VLVDAATEAAVPDSAMTETVLHFLRPGRVGPIEAAARRIGGDDGSVVLVEITDVGANRRIALANGTVATAVRTPL
jgi:acyl-coenzyme A thioesterase PaaI-like protein